MEQKEILTELLDAQKKTLKSARARTVLALIAVCVLVAGLALTLYTVRTVLQPARIGALLDETEDALLAARDAFQNAAGVDVDALNAMIDKLDQESGNLPDALNNISQLDPEAINNLLVRIDDVMNMMDRLSAVMERISAIFGR